MLTFKQFIAESENLDLCEANFAAAMKKAVDAHERGDTKRAAYHLDNARTARYAMKSTEIAKHKELLDQYSKLRDHYVKNESIEVCIEDFSVEELQEFMQTEEYEQLDELSKGTLASYINKAVGGMEGSARHAFDAGRHQGSNDELSHKSFEKARKRISGVKRAVNKLAEESEQLDELSKTTLQSYIGKSVQDVGQKAFSAGVQRMDRSNPETPAKVQKNVDKMIKRQHGIVNAARKLARESEQLEEGGEKHAYRMGLQHGAKGVKKIDAEKTFGIFAKDYHRGYEQGKDSADWHDDKASKAPLSVRAK